MDISTSETVEFGGSALPARRPGQDQPAQEDLPVAPTADGALGLVQLSWLVQGAFARVAERHDVTPVQGRLLCILAERPRLMAELARGLDVEKAALTGLIDRAEKRQLVARGPVPEDRRATRISLTNKGRESAAAFHAHVTAELERLLDALEPAERDVFQAGMTTITRSAGLGTGWEACPRPGAS